MQCEQNNACRVFHENEGAFEIDEDSMNSNASGNDHANECDDVSCRNLNSCVFGPYQVHLAIEGCDESEFDRNRSGRARVNVRVNDGDVGDDEIDVETSDENEYEKLNEKLGVVQHGKHDGSDYESDVYDGDASGLEPSDFRTKETADDFENGEN